MLRNLLSMFRRFKLASSLNVIGLSTAFAAFMVIMIQVRYELTFDTSYPTADRIYRLNSHIGNMGKLYNNMFHSSSSMYHTYKELSPGVEKCVMLGSSWTPVYVSLERNNQKVGFNDMLFYATEEFADVFGLKFISGRNTLAEPNMAILPRSVAEKYFGTVYCVGKTFKTIYGNMTVGGTFEDFPENSQMYNEAYLTFPEQWNNPTEWNRYNYIIYMLLRPGVTQKQVEADLDKFDIKKATAYRTSVDLISIKDIHMTETEYYSDEKWVKKGNHTTLAILFSIALLIILIAAINFVNFATSMAPLRIKSINTQKVMGCLTSRLRAILVGEAVGIALLAFAIGIFWVWYMGLTPLRDLTAAGIQLGGNWAVIGGASIVALLVGLLAGVYPAYYTTSFPAALVLKGSFGLSPKGRALRTVLIGVQFVISITLIIATLFLHKQNNYMRNMDTGFDRDRIALIQVGGEIQNKQQSFTTKLKQFIQIEDVAYAQFAFGRDNMAQGWNRKFNGTTECGFRAMQVSWNFPQVMGIKLKEGEYFNEQTENKDVFMTFLFNERAAKEFDLKAPRRFKEWDADTSAIYSDISGILSNFNVQTLQQGIEPFAFAVVGKRCDWGGNYKYGYVKYSGESGPVIDHIRRSAAEFDPVYPIQIDLFDAAFDQTYKAEIKSARMITWFSILSIILSLVGVFGIVVFETQYRRKEIGVRKVYGSTISQILVRLNTKFVYSLAICSAIAIPSAYFLVDMWLEGFAYRTSMDWWIFAAGVVIVAFITLLTVTIQSYRAATENPIRALKSE